MKRRYGTSDEDGGAAQEQAAQDPATEAKVPTTPAGTNTARPSGVGFWMGGIGSSMIM